ncbi:Histidine phosphatase family protein [Sporosarcina sp. ANT_H38]|uniref:histidine phosphatase family protein n=1 Tax=Sporosarcina sp. ANT_H38 TaxID=2597358 RepID=UPI00165D69FD|nr:histidine phosphatase family protein [Sporosarcina sp. ANT_H38]
MASNFVLYLIRHLPTLGNKERKYIGWTDEPILDSPNWNWGLPEIPKHVYSSDLNRAKQSAAHYFPQASIEIAASWRECNFGDFEGKTYVELEKNKDYRKWIDDPYAFAPSGGESLKDVEIRVVAALKQLPNNAVVVTHGGPIRVVLSKYSLDQQGFWSWDIPHGTGYRLEWDSDKAFEEGESCTSISAVPITAKETM